MKSRYLIIVLILASCRPAPRQSPQPTGAVTARNDAFEIATTYIETLKGPAIHFEFTWLASGPISLYPFELPWGNPNSLDLWARDSSGSEIQVVIPIADPGPESLVTLSAGSSLEGDFLLASRIPNISEVLTRSALTVMWRYPRGGSPKHLRGSLTGRIAIAQHSARPSAV